MIEMLLQPSDFANLAALETDWKMDFPGMDPILANLRNTLIATDWQHRRADQSYEETQLVLHATGLPMEFWNCRAFRLLNRVERYKNKCLRAFMQSMKAVDRLS